LAFSSYSWPVSWLDCIVFLSAKSRAYIFFDNYSI
jgi:hypothetical protein